MSHRSLPAWAGLAAALAVGAVAVALVRLAGPEIYCGDGYFHVRFADVLRHEGFSRTFPWFQESIQREAYANFNLLYHLLLIPLTFGDLATGARIAGIAGGALATGAFWGALRALRTPGPLGWTVLLLGAAPELLYRLTFTRPLVLSLALTWLGTAAILLGRHRWAAVAGLAFTHVHVSFHVLPAVAVAHDLLREAPGETLWQRFRTSVWTCAGVAVGLLASPYVPNNFRFWVTANLGVLGYSWSHADEARLATEMVSVRTDVFLWANLGAFAATAAAVVLLTWVRKVTDEARTLLVVTLGFFGLSLLSRRFAEHWAPFSFMLLAVAVGDALREGLPVAPPPLRRLPALLGFGSPARRLATGLAFAASVVLLVLSVQADRAAAAAEEVEDYADASTWMADHVPAADTLFHPGYDEFGPLFFHDPRRRFLTGLDPTFFLAADRERFELWGRVARGEVGDAWEPIRRTFRCRWVFLPSRFVSLGRLLDRDPRFERRYRDRQCTVYAVTDDPGHEGTWTVRGWYPDPRRTWLAETRAGGPPGSAQGPGAAGIEVRGSGYVDLRRALAVPSQVRDVCAVATTRIAAPPGSVIEVEVATDDEVRLAWDGGAAVERSPYAHPPPGSPGGPPLALADLGRAAGGVPRVVASGEAVALSTTLTIATCQVGRDFGFVLRPRPAAAAASP